MRDRVRLDETGLTCGRRFIAAQKTHYTASAVAPSGSGKKESVKSMRFRLAATAICLLLAGLIVATIAAAPGSLLPADSETEPTNEITVVRGIVYNSGGLPVVGADVNVSMYDGATLRSYQSDVSDSSGGYTVTFGPMPGAEPWAIGDTILVFAEEGDYSGTNSTVAVDDVFQDIDVKLNVLIPEFGDLGALVPIAGVFGIFMALFFVRRERKP